MSDEVTALVKAAKALADAVHFDVNGIRLPTGFQGGNGGLTNNDTLAKADAVLRAVDRVGRKA